MSNRMILLVISLILSTTLLGHSQQVPPAANDASTRALIQSQNDLIKLLREKIAILEAENKQLRADLAKLTPASPPAPINVISPTTAPIPNIP